MVADSMTDSSGIRNLRNNVSVLPAKPVIEVNNVYKSFDRRVVGGGYTTFKTQLVQFFRQEKYEQIQHKKIEVLQGISFAVMPGETVGIIGQNGAGKSTLLKLLTGIYKPTKGSVQHRGRISALLELGAGFHPEFSGRENIYMNGMILGLSKKELRVREPEIIEFSELEDFIDAPVRTYSSGMYMRLAFAIAVNVNPDILIIDEILAVGDEHFQHKSKAKLDEFKTKQCAIILVTHGLSTVESWCSRAVWLANGRVLEDGDPHYVVTCYKRQVEVEENEQRKNEQRKLQATELSTSQTTDTAETTQIENLTPEAQARIELIKTRIFDDTGRERFVFQSNERFAIELEYKIQGEFPGLSFELHFFSSQNQPLFTTQSRAEGLSVDSKSKHGWVYATFPATPLAGRYIRVDVSIKSKLTTNEHQYYKDIARLDFIDRKHSTGVLSLATSWSQGMGPQAVEKVFASNQNILAKDVDLRDLGELYNDFLLLGVAPNHQLPSAHFKNQRCKAPILSAYIQQAIAKTKQQTEDAATFLELNCTDGFYTMLARHFGATHAVGVHGEHEAHYGKPLMIAERLGMTGVEFYKWEWLANQQNPQFNIVTHLGSLYMKTNPRAELEHMRRLGSDFVILQSVVSLANKDVDYFETPAPGLNGGCRFSKAWLEALLDTIGFRIIDAFENELEGNARLEDRGSVYYLMQASSV